MVNYVLRLPAPIYTSSEHTNATEKVFAFSVHYLKEVDYVQLPLVKGEARDSFSCARTLNVLLLRGEHGNLVGACPKMGCEYP